MNISKKDVGEIKSIIEEVTARNEIYMAMIKLIKSIIEKAEWENYLEEKRERFDDEMSRFKHFIDDSLNKLK